MIPETTIDRVLERLAQSGELDLIVHTIASAAALIEGELLQKLSTFPVGEPSDLAAFAYRQGWLRGLKQVQAIFDADRARARPPSPTARSHAERLAFADDLM